MWIAEFGGLSPLRGPLATVSAEAEDSKTAFDEARTSAGCGICEGENECSAEHETVGLDSRMDRFWHRPPVRCAAATQSACLGSSAMSSIARYE
jgi:hypothetical protein